MTRDIDIVRFLRFYGLEFDAGERERIAAWLGRDEPGSHVIGA